MTTTYTNTTVGQLVTERPRRSKVFEQYGIDYCCGGKKPLSDACEEKKIDLSAVISDLQKLDAQPREGSEIDWTQRPLAELADHIEKTHHVFLRQALPRISALTGKVADVHGPRKPELLDVHATFKMLRAELESHMMKEEMVLFPMLRELDTASAAPSFHCGSVRNPISAMEHEHDVAGDALAKLEKLTSGYVVPEDACGTYRAMLDALAELQTDTHEHIHKENEILFPRGAAREAELMRG
jgi:regulator of cell morphogenesis and NO signaling